MDHFIKQWRKFRGLTMQQLAERLELSVSTFSRIERYRQSPTLDLIGQISVQLDCSPGELITRDPSRPDDMWAVWNSMTAEERARVFAVAKALKDTPDGH